MKGQPNIINSLYMVEGKLDSGGGVVYKAWHTHLQKYVKDLKCGTRDNIEAQRNKVEALKNVKSIYLPQVKRSF